MVGDGSTVRERRGQQVSQKKAEEASWGETRQHRCSRV